MHHHHSNNLCDLPTDPTHSSSSSHPKTTPTLTKPHHTHSSSLLTSTTSNSSGYYSRLDSTDSILEASSSSFIQYDDDHTPCHPLHPLHPWQWYVTPISHHTHSDHDPTSSSDLGFSSSSSHTPQQTSSTPLHHPPFYSSSSTTPTTLTTILSSLPHCSLAANLQNERGETPLMVAMATGRVDLVQVFIQAFSAGSSSLEAALGVRDFKGNNVIHLGVWLGEVDGVREVLEGVCGGGGGAGGSGGLLEAANWEGHTPLHLAITSPLHPLLMLPSHKDHHHHLLPLLQLLLSSHPHPASYISKQEGKAGRTALHLAVERRNGDALELFLKHFHGEDSIFINKENYAGMTAYEMAVCNEWAEGVEIFERGVVRGVVGGAVLRNSYCYLMEEDCSSSSDEEGEDEE